MLTLRESAVHVANLEEMMEDFIYNLFLTSELGFSLPGTLRYRAAMTAESATKSATESIAVSTARSTPDAPTAGPAEAEHAAAAPLPAQPIDLFETPLQGVLVAPLLTGIAPVPLRGFLYSTAAGPLTVVLFNTGTPQVSLQFNFLVTDTIAGGLAWQPVPSTQASALYSVLGRRVAQA
jgi:hypothetical protein